MSRSRWLIPTVSIVASLALGVGGAIAGANLAPHSTHLVKAGTQTAMVLAPLAGGAPAKDGATSALSSIVAERVVPQLSADPHLVDPSLTHIVDLLSHAVNPVVVRHHIAPTAGNVGEEINDDLCAPRYSPNPLGCPAGLHATLSGTAAVPEYLIVPQAFPPTHNQFLAVGNPYGGDLWCQDSGWRAGNTWVPFGILSTEPSSFHISIHPLDDASNVTYINYATTSGDIQQFAEDTAAAAGTGETPYVRNCLSLYDLQPNTEYSLDVTSSSSHGRTAAASLNFNSSGAAVHPSAQITTLGENMVIVTALRKANEVADIRAYTVPSSLPAPGCDNVDLSAALPPLIDDDVSLTDAEVAAQNAPREFNHRHLADITVPEGSTILICAKWFSAGTSPLTPGAIPNWQSSAVVQSPDRVNARLSLNGVTATPAAGINHIQFLISTGGGGVATCTATWNWLHPAPLPQTLCDLGELRGNALSHLSYRDGMTDGTFRIEAINTLRNGTTVTTQPFMISDGRGVAPLTAGGCRGTCALPPTTYWGIDLSSTGHGPIEGSCIDSESTQCVPQLQPGSIGVIGLTLSYSQGPQNGAAHWIISPVTDVPLGSSLPNSPQFDLTKQWTFDSPTVPAGSATGQPLPSVTGLFELDVDRPVDYTIRFTNFTPGVAAPSCATGGAVLQLSGHVDHSGPIRMEGACVGQHYIAEISLRDAQGRTSEWTPLAGPGLYWAQGDVHVSRAMVNISYAVSAQGDPHSVLTNFDLSFDQHDVGIVNINGGPCLSDGLVHSSGVAPYELAVDTDVQLWINILPQDPGHPENCALATRSDTFSVVDAHVTMADLFSPTGVVITSPGTHNVRIVLHASQP